MNIKEIEKVIELMNANGITEFVLEKEGVKIALKKGAGVVASHPEYVFQQLHPYHTAPASSPAVEAKASSKASEAAQEPADFICSPIVGTFYKAPSPDAEPYVKTGQNIEKGQVVCIVEAMKVMNEIKSDISGIVEEIMVENGDPVEFNQKMFRIKKK